MFFRNVFRDGSKKELSLIWFFLILEIVNLYFATTSLSIGQFQLNIFFASWLGFLIMVRNHDIWRVGAGLSSVLKSVRNHSQSTLFWWCLVLFFSTAATASIGEFYLVSNANDQFSSYEENTLGSYLNEFLKEFNKWGFLFSVLLSTMAISLISIIINITIKSILALKFWRCIEGWLLFVLMVLWVYAASNFTSRRFFLIRPCNEYFGVWGTFLSSARGFGAWIGEMSKEVLSNEALSNESLSHEEEN